MTLSIDTLLADPSGRLTKALAAGQAYLAGTPQADLLSAVGRVIDAVPTAPWPDKRWLQKSYGRSVTDTPDDLMVGQGLFYLTEQRRLMLDGTAGHYQMTWGYDHPELRALLLDAVARGVVWDDHSNIPAAPVKRLAAKLVELANPGLPADRLQADPERLNTVLIGVCTGSVACSSAMKIMLVHYERAKAGRGTPVFITLAGNYHGTDLFAQRLRGMWPQYFANVESVELEPNDAEALEAAFRRYGERVAGFLAEPIMMNREAIFVNHSYLQLARRLCDQTGALMMLDEIQTGFFYPEVFYTLRTGVEPDFIVLGKGMTAGLHPLSALLYKGKLDCLAMYDAISTNGGAALAALLGLGCIALIEREADRVGKTGERFHKAMAGLCDEFPAVLAGVRGAGHLTGLKFHRVGDALACHQAALARGLWVRAHAYHAGHSTVLTKFALPLDEEVCDWTVTAMREVVANA